ncbi:hypothetical protein [Dysgonomonas sp. 520]|uniref:hypothetical protein n=1 Tax=Dysgonomonas sp. 520 TaxID=2302931 RepID=UPI001C87350F|nr:hypothetical protein [Dysgonomonas sp. 520]NDW11149.1 hypothetical protein [Dysgonomonas sp. 520]
MDSQIIDTIHQKRYIYLYSKKAKDGYCFVNKAIMDEIKKKNFDLCHYKILYVYNDKNLSTKDEVDQILRLRKKNSLILSIFLNEELKVIYVFITDK